MLIPEGSQANLEPVARAFQASTGVPVALKLCGVDDVATEMTLRTLAGEADFDLGLPPTFSLPDLVEAGIIQGVDPLLHEPNAPATPSLYPLGDSYKGSTYGFQTDGDVYLMFYNRALLEDAEKRARFADRYGRELSVPRTWEELDQAMEFFHRPAQQQFGGALFRSPGYIGWEYWIRLHAKGIFPVDDEMRPLLDTEEGVAAGEELIRASRWLGPNAESASLFENWETFSAGRTFCNIGWGGSQKYFRRPDSPVRDGIVNGLTPGGVLGGKVREVSYFNWGWNFTISSQTPRPELSARFAQFATTGSPALEAVRAADGFFDPFREEHYRDSEVEATYTRPFLQKHSEAMGSAIPDFYLEGRGEYFDLLGRFLARANAGKMTAREALETIAKGWELITERNGRQSQIVQWQFLKSRYPAGLRDALRSDR